MLFVLSVLVGMAAGVLGTCAAIATVLERKDGVPISKYGQNVWVFLLHPEDLDEHGKRHRVLVPWCFGVQIVCFILAAIIGK